MKRGAAVAAAVAIVLGVQVHHLDDRVSALSSHPSLTAAEQAVFSRYDQSASVPVLDFGNRSVFVGASFSPLVLKQQTWSQIAAALRDPASLAGQAILGTANYITAAICQLTGDQPARACAPMVRKLLGP